MIDLLLKTFVKNYRQTDDPDVREAYGSLSGIVGILLNLLLCAGKFVAGLLTGAVSITADAFNNLSDAASSVVTLIGFRLAGQEADDDHPYGHGRMEYLAGLAVSVVILLVGLELAKGAVEKILHPEEVVFSYLSAGILAASIAVKLWMYRFNSVLGKRINSAAMAATAADALSDCVATGAVLLGLIVSRVAGLSIDGWVGILVAFFVLRAGWESAKDTLDPLLGQAPDPELVKGIEETVLARPEILGVHDLMVHDYGPSRVMVSLHAEVSLHADMAATHDAIDDVEKELAKKFHIIATIHMDPIAVDDELINARRMEMIAVVRSVHPDMSLHDFRMTEGPTHTNLIFDVVKPHSCPLTDEEVKKEIFRRAQERSPRYFTVVQVDHPYTSQ